MTTFKEIRGTTIEVVSSDPSNPELGQIWYNSSSGTLKGYQLVATNAWSSGGNLSVNGGRSVGFGTQDAAIAGDIYLGPTGFQNTFQSYNGTSWSSSPALNTSRDSASGNSGTSQTAGLTFGGNPVPGPASTATESWNGSSWTTVNSLPTGKSYVAGTGTQTAALAFAGYDGAAYVGTGDIWNGTSWTSIPATLNTTRSGVYGFGTQTAAIAASGYPITTNGTKTESYNGTTWTNVNSLNTARGAASLVGISQTAGLAFAGEGSPGAPVNQTESWNGTSWTVISGTLATARESVKGIGTQGLALAVGGYSNPGPPTYTYNATEEWTGTQLLVRTVTVS
jgi:hypothetical protein